MKKSYLVMAAAAALFAACSSNDLVEEKAPQTTQPTDEQVVGFDAYVNRGTTRGGYEGSLTATSIKESAAYFGVFGYYTNNVLYGQTAIPDFFYNQKVTHDGSSWTYSPIKYWPNEFGTGAESAGQDKLTFFAYAPYVEVNPGTGRMASAAAEKYGIVGMTSNTTSGDPYVKYIASFDPDTRVDLCYGVANSAFTSSVDGSNNNVAQGKPYIDVIKPKVGDKIFFNFKHALASLNVTIDADIDELSHGDAAYLDGNTKIYVRKVTFEGFADKGSLNLNSEATSENYAPNWFELNSINRRLSSGTVTIYDGRRDGREGQANAEASNETPNNLNSTIIQKESATAGVPATAAVNLFDSETLDAPIFVIPTEEDLKVTIVYDVETADINLSTYLSDGKTKGSSVENTITKAITLSSGASPLKLKAGKAYKVSLHLGMTSVKFDATVTDWPTTTVADNTDLPYNTPGVGAGSTNSFSIDASTTTGSFVVSGLTTGNLLHTSGTSPVLNTKVNGAYYTSGTGIAVPSSGEATISYTVPANTSVSNKAFTVYANERKSDDNSLVTSTVANVTQLCKPFVPSIAWAGGDKQFNITADGTSGDVTEDEWDAAIITVEKSTDGGTTYTKLTKDTDYSIIRPTGRVVVRFGTAPTSCNIKITIKVGDGDAKEYIGDN